jgi:16S rRNA (guanine527-N7)-methyltransferase
VNPSTAAQLQTVIAELQLELTDEQLQMLARYCELLWQWNERLNLTRHTDPATFANRDLWDTMQLSPFLAAGEHVLDVGSGGGTPGIVLAIVRPDLQLELSESVGKKADALRSMIASLQLPLTVLGQRAEQVVLQQPYDALVARAVGPLWKMCKWFQPCWHNIGRLLVIKGPRWAEERGEARHRGLLKNVQLRRVHTYPMPGTSSESVILKLWGRERPEV